MSKDGEKHNNYKHFKNCLLNQEKGSFIHLFPFLRDSQSCLCYGTVVKLVSATLPPIFGAGWLESWLLHFPPNSLVTSWKKQLKMV